MERKIEYKNKDGSIQVSYFTGYTMKRIRENLKEIEATILCIYKLIECKYCNGEGIIWKKEK